jgi:hypothetical protein
VGVARALLSDPGVGSKPASIRRNPACRTNSHNNTSRRIIRHHSFLNRLHYSQDANNVRFSSFSLRKVDRFHRFTPARGSRRHERIPDCPARHLMSYLPCRVYQTWMKGAFSPCGARARTTLHTRRAGLICPRILNLG